MEASSNYKPQYEARKRRPADHGAQEPGTSPTKSHPLLPEEDPPLSALQQHVLFWDRDNDGIIHPTDIWNGFRELGFGLFISALALLIPVFFSYPTRLGHSWLPDPLMRIYVGDIHKAKHGSDTGVYDLDGNFSADRFERLFARSDASGRGGLAAAELAAMWRKNRCAADVAGWTFALMEWSTTFLLLQRDGRVWKEDLRSCYDGTLFWKISDARAKSDGWNQGYGPGDFFAGLRTYGTWDPEKQSRAMARENE